MKADYVCQDCGSRVINEVALAPSRKKDCPYCGGRLWHEPGVTYFAPRTVEAFGALAKAVGANSITICGTDHQIKGDDMNDSPAPDLQPDLRTLEGQLSFLDYHSPSVLQQTAHAVVNDAIQAAWIRIAGVLPPGPGVTVALRSLNRARMDANSAIANHGA